MKWRTRGTRVAARPGGAKASDAHPAPDAPGYPRRRAAATACAPKAPLHLRQSGKVRADHGASFAGAAVVDGLICPRNPACETR